MLKQNHKMAISHKTWNIKKTCFFIVLVMPAFLAHAQKPRFCIFAGPQSTSAKYRIMDVKQPTTNKFGFQAGVGMKVPFETNLFFAPAIFYSHKGYKVKFNRFAYPPDTAALDNNTSIHTVELAFLLQYDMGNQPAHFFIKAGPTLDFQLKGKEKFNLKGGGSVNRSMIYSFGEYGIFAANLLMQFGFETGSGFMIFGQYSLGITDINNADDGPQINHRAFGITIGKYFNKKKITLDTSNKE